ncbi:MAG: SRPBCC family protein [Actinomycetota bacterium]
MKAMVVERRGQVEAPPEKVWPLVDDVGRLPEWFTFAESAELLEGEGMGRRQRIHGHWGKKRSEVDQVIVEHRPPRRLAWRHEAERLDGKPAPRFAAETVFTIDLAPAGTGTEVTLRSSQVPAGPVRGVLMRAFGGREVAGHLEKSLDRLAAVVGTAA